jgi:hypothetical protein
VCTAWLLPYTVRKEIFVSCKSFPVWIRTILSTRNGAAATANDPFCLVLFLACFLAAALASQRFFYSLSLAGLQVKRVTFYFFNNVLSLYLPLEPPKRVFQGFTLLKSNFRQRTTPPYSSQRDSLVMASITILSQVHCTEICVAF